jgi:hypothetical protein
MHSVWLDCFSEICLYRNRTLHAVFWPINYLTLFKTVFTVSTYAGFFVFLFQPSLCAAFFQDPFAPSLMVPAVIGLGNRCCLQAWDESSAFAFFTICFLRNPVMLYFVPSEVYLYIGITSLCL